MKMRNRDGDTRSFVKMTSKNMAGNAFASFIKPIKALFPSLKKSNSSARGSETTGDFNMFLIKCKITFNSTVVKIVRNLRTQMVLKETKNCLPSYILLYDNVTGLKIILQL